MAKKYLHEPTHRQTSSPNPMHHITAVEYVRFVGYNWCFLPTPPYSPYFFHNTQHICPRVPRGLLIGQAQEHHVITAKLLTIGPRVAIYEAFCPGILPYPCPGQVIHQEALTGRENQSHLRYLTASTRYHHGLVICEGAAKKRAVYLGRESVAVVGFHAR